MIIRWLNTNAAELSSMVNVNDEMIRSCSNGEVKNPEYGALDSLDSSEIFGEIGNGELLMGHIELPIPVVNIQYLYGRKPVLPDMLGMDRDALSRIARHSAYVVIDPGTEKDLAYKQIFSFKEFEELKHGRVKPGDAVILTGGEAIEALLKKAGCPERDKIILRTIPVLPADLRYKECSFECNGKTVVHRCYFQIEMLYHRLLWRSGRVRRLLKLDMPEIIRINEGRMLQEMANDLINNGADGHPAQIEYGVPAESLQETYEYITGIRPAEGAASAIKKCVSLPKCFEFENAAEMKKLAKEYVAFVYDDDDNDNDAGDDNDSDGSSSNTATYDDGTDFFEKKEAYKEQFAKLAEPLAEVIFNKCFFKFAEFKDDFLKAAEYGLKTAVDNFDTDSEIDGADICKLLVPGIYGNMKFFARKRVLYEG